MQQTIIVSVLLFVLCSCSSRIPEPINYPYSQQNTMQASYHWDILAKDLANRINNELIITDNIERSVFVKETCGDETTPCEQLQTSSFNEAFRDLLITNLFDYGVPTNNIQDEQTIDVLYKVQVVRHNARRVRTTQPGLLTAIAAGIVVLRDAPSSLVILAAGVAADIANSNLSLNGKYEVIITTSMLTNNQYLFRASDIYYINDKDFFHYQGNSPSSATIQLSSKQKKPPKKTMPTAHVTPLAPLEPQEPQQVGKGI